MWRLMPAGLRKNKEKCLLNRQFISACNKIMQKRAVNII
ncbi:hypothetical protein AC79_0074 [Escherichia coli 8-415-05_S4_C1]|uniref:Uncharacterized protein n=1 Tax=Escherichia coli DEC2D TaxID=868141 RepID=A0A828UAE5_ECOLX|nr:hypothetical protein i02_0089 [Escherichia coli str. 'clone D i2']AER87606.1 hypothetical protein i14_0089 [Escherichia coli str. 'clone D i14']AWZ80448.1 hypothetical protein CSC38_4758 [Escherichia coli]EFR17345.1 hypothetical protein EC236275_2022 [Escherichia coli 2362-75]EFZ75514.1 hypothetical protein ECRN5871_1393 [Escherichia coli RN587/1]EHG02643.1 hypothetical protein i01_00112 [Escherichia coli cloneA_i1]EHU15350.1 hypothetical protein ECDEC1A_0080 [Escherichia coli DEC1A]EHU16